MVSAGCVDTVLIGDNFPELGSNLVSALAGLNVNDFSHFEVEVFFTELS